MKFVIAACLLGIVLAAPQSDSTDDLSRIGVIYSTSNIEQPPIFPYDAFGIGYDQYSAFGIRYDNIKPIATSSQSSVTEPSPLIEPPSESSGSSSISESSSESISSLSSSSSSSYSSISSVSSSSISSVSSASSSISSVSSASSLSSESTSESTSKSFSASVSISLPGKASSSSSESMSELAEKVAAAEVLSESTSDSLSDSQSISKEIELQAPTSSEALAVDLDEIRTVLRKSVKQLSQVKKHLRRKQNVRSELNEAIYEIQKLSDKIRENLPEKYQYGEVPCSK